MYMRVIIFKSTPILKPINLRVFSLLIKIWATITSCLGDFWIFCIMSAATTVLPAGLLSLWDHWLHTVSTLAPQQPLQVESSTTTTFIFSCAIVSKLGVETAKGAREINLKGHGMINIFCELRDYFTSSGL